MNKTLGYYLFFLFNLSRLTPHWGEKVSLAHPENSRLCYQIGVGRGKKKSKTLVSLTLDGFIGLYTPII